MMPVTPSVSSGGAMAGLSKQQVGANGLAGEVERLREQLGREQAETNAVVDQYTSKIDRLIGENHQMQVSLQRLDNKELTQTPEMMSLKSTVLDNTAAIEKVMLEFQQQQQATVARIKSLTGAMLTSCATAPAETGGCVYARAPDVVVSSTSLDGLTNAGGNIARGFDGLRPGGHIGRVHDGLTSGGNVGANISRIASEGTPPESEAQKWLRSVKANLEHFGDVEVFSDSSPYDCECCMETILTHYRVRPRRCSHIFHVECLLQLWSEGTCPVCGVSFAPE